MRAALKGLLGSGRGRVLLMVGALAAVAALSGALAAIYYRPRAAPAAIEGAVGFAVSAAAALRVAHQLAAYALLPALLAWGLLAGTRGADGEASGRKRALGSAGVAALVLASLITGHLVPWEQLLPWAPRVGPNMARTTPLLGQEGPFPELVGVNVRYDDALVTIGSRRLGPRAVRRIFWLHAAVLPGLAVAAGVAAGIAARRRRDRG